MLRCSLCDYCLEVSSMMSDRKAERPRYCPNEAAHRGVKVLMFHSLK